jgi:hypothetical protein
MLLSTLLLAALLVVFILDLESTPKAIQARLIDRRYIINCASTLAQDSS